MQFINGTLVIVSVLGTAFYVYSQYHPSAEQHIPASTEAAVPNTAQQSLASNSPIPISANLNAGGLFGTTAPEPPSLDKAQETDRDYRLIGIMNAPDDGRVAAIVEIDNKQHFLTLGDALDDETHLLSIAKDHIVFSDGQRAERLGFKHAREMPLFATQKNVLLTKTQRADESITASKELTPAVQTNDMIRQKMAAIVAKPIDWAAAATFNGGQ